MQGTDEIVTGEIKKGQTLIHSHKLSLAILLL